MNITLNTSTPNTTSRHQPNFTARINGTALRMAFKEAKDAFQLGEIAEIVDNVSIFGDKATQINCAADGLVTVCNDKFGNYVHKFKLKKNDKTENPFLDMLRSFNSQNRIMKLEFDLLDSVFAHSKNKEAKYKLFSTYPLSTPTQAVLDAAAHKNGVPVPGRGPVPSPEQSKAAFEKLRNALMQGCEAIQNKK